MDPTPDQPRDNQTQPQPSVPPANDSVSETPAPSAESSTQEQSDGFDRPVETTQSPVAETDLPQQPQPATVVPVVAPLAPTQAQPAASKGLAIAALVIGIIAFLTGFIGVGILLGIIAIVLGAVVLFKHKPGKAMAIAAIVLGAIAVFVGGILFLLFVSLASFGNIQDRAVQSEQKADATLEQKQAQVDAIQDNQDVVEP